MKPSSCANTVVLAVINSASFATSQSIGAAPDRDQQTNAASVPPAYTTVRDGRIDKNAIPAHEATWALFAAVAGLENERATTGRKVLRDDIGLTEKSADALLGYIRAAVEAVRVSALEVTEQTCGLRNTLTSRVALTDRLVETDRKIDREREMHVKNMGRVLDQQEQAKVDAWVDGNLRSTMQITTFDYAVYLAVEHVTPEMFLDRLCKPQSTS